MIAPSRRRRGLRTVALALAAALLGSATAVATTSAAVAAPTVVEVDDATTAGSPRFEYSAGWNAERGLPDAWFANTEHTASAPGAEVTLHFTGTRAVLFGNHHPAHGIYDVIVDGGAPVRVDAYAPAMSQQQELFDTGVIADAAHTVTLRLTGDKNPLATAAHGQIDYAVVNDTTPPPDPAAWAAIPQPQTQELTGAAAWTPSDATRIFLLRDQQQQLQREADRLSSEMASVLGGTATPIVVGDAAQMAAGDIVLRTGEVAGHAGDEAFSIETTDRVVATGTTPEGVFRATRQLLQNLTATESVPAGRVAGSPAVGERALHLDLARKFYPAEWIKAELRDMAYVGVNSFQFHFSENEGFRVESESFPEIVSDEHLTKDEVREIVALAEDLHIDVVPALNMPGHLDWALNASPELKALRLRDANGAPVRGALDITNPEAVAFAEALVDEYVELFPHSTHWAIGADEFVPFERIELYPSLRDTAVERFGEGATGFDLLTDFANRIADRVAEHGFVSRVWNDGMFRGTKVQLHDGIQINWWTNWERGMAPVKAALDRGHDVLNYNDSLFYYVLGEHAGYKYPTAERIWAADWQPGVFPRLPQDNAAGIPDVNQVLTQPYPEQLLGASFAIWSDQPNTDTIEQISAGIREPLRAQNERSWNGGSRLDLETFTRTEARIERAPGIAVALGQPGATTVLDGGQPPVVDPPVVDPPVVDPPVVDPPVVGQPAARPGGEGAVAPNGRTGERLASTGGDAAGPWVLGIAALAALVAGAGILLRARARRS